MTPHRPQDPASAWVARFARLIPPGEVLDLACGGGRHARLLASLGHPVLAVDRDAQALASAAGQGIVTRQIDLEAEGATWPFEDERFAGIVVTNYLHRPLFASLLRALAPGGILIYETFAQGNEQFGKPSNPLFLLKPGELLHIVANDGSGFHILAFEDGYVDMPRPAMVQRICAVKADTAFSPQRFHL